MAWNDSRLLNHTHHDKDDHQKMIVPRSIMDNFWKPDIFIFGSKSSFIHQTTMENRMMRLVPATGEFAYSIKMTAKIQCELHLEYYPFDEQTCELIFQSCK